MCKVAQEYFNAAIATSEVRTYKMTHESTFSFNFLKSGHNNFNH